MSLATYADLKTAVANWLNRTDLTANIPDFIALAQARINRDLRVRAQVVNSTLSLVAGTNYVALPADFLEFENLSVGAGPQRQLSYATPEQMDARYPPDGDQGIPQIYTVIGSNLYVGPPPDSNYTVYIQYYQKWTALSADSDTNWLLTNHPGVYLWGALSEAAPFLADDPRIQVWEAKYAADSQAVQDADDTALRSGSVLRVRTL